MAFDSGVCPHQGMLYNSTRPGRRGRKYPILRCNKCWKYWSARNGPIADRGQLRNVDDGCWLSFRDRNGHPCSIKTILLIVFCWAKDLTISQTHSFLTSLLSPTKDETLVDWRNFISEVLLRAFHAAALMGGPGEVVQIDESCFRINTPRKQGGLGEMKIPLLADKNTAISREYGVLKEDAGLTYRGLFIVDDKGILRQITINDLPVGRDVDETIRLVQAFQFTDKHGEVCPANWKPGDKTMKPDPKGSKEYFEKVSVRILTFILNGLVIRYISKEALGVANVRLALFYTTVLFLSHEAFRKACLSSQTSGKWQQVINILWLSVPLSVVCSIIIGWVWIHLLEAPGPEITTDYGLCVILIAVSTVIEKLSEPLYVTSQAFHFVRLREKFNEAQQVLQALVKLMLIFGLTVVCFGQAYSHLFLHLYGGTTLSSGIGPTLLQAHCLYVLFLALNGITEAFAFATMTRKEIDLYNLKLAWFSLLFIILSWLFTHFLGPVGFILANCANMVARILHRRLWIANACVKCLIDACVTWSKNLVACYNTMASSLALEEELGHHAGLTKGTAILILSQANYRREDRPNGHPSLFDLVLMLEDGVLSWSAGTKAQSETRLNMIGEDRIPGEQRKASTLPRHPFSLAKFQKRKEKDKHESPRTVQNGLEASSPSESDSSPAKKRSKSFLTHRPSLRKVGNFFSQMVKHVSSISLSHSSNGSAQFTNGVHNQTDPGICEVEERLGSWELYALSKEEKQQHWFGDKVPGVAGLRNHGNTCFINAVLQCLVHTDPLAEYMSRDCYKTDLVKRNKFNSKKYGTQGEVTEELAKLIGSIWTCQYSPDMTTDFKSVIDKHGSQYRGSSQHDAQEFLLWLLDKVHEDLNTARKKKYKRTRSTVGRPDEDVAAEALANHLRCHNSYIQALFQAQFRSSLTCPHCKSQSNTFDPFLCLSIPIPQRQMRPVLATVIYFSQQPREVKLGFNVSANASIKELREIIAADTGLDESHLILTEIDGEGFHRTFSGPELCLIQKATVFPGEEFPDKLSFVMADSQPLSVLGEDATHALYVLEMPPTKEPTETDGAFILLAWINLLYSADCCTRFGAPYIMQVSRETSYEDLQKLLLKEMQQVVKPSVLTTQQKVPLFGIKVVSGDKELPELSKDMDHPLYAESIEHGLSLCDDCSGPAHVKLVLAWLPEDKEGVIVVDSELLEEHESVKQLENSPQIQPVVTLEECFQLYTSEERLGAENAWLCPSCNRKQEVVKSLALWSLPQILVIHLKRFRQFSNQRTTSKLTTMVDFPLTSFDLSSHLVPRKKSENQANGPNGMFTMPPLNGLTINHHHQSSWATLKWVGKKSATLPAYGRLGSSHEDHLYDLYAVVNHHGSDLQGGHYTAYCKNSMDGKWYEFDDTQVESLSEGALVTQDAYLLFYQRRSHASSSSESGFCHWTEHVTDIQDNGRILRDTERKGVPAWQEHHIRILPMKAGGPPVSGGRARRHTDAIPRLPGFTRKPEPLSHRTPVGVSILLWQGSVQGLSLHARLGLSSWDISTILTCLCQPHPFATFSQDREANCPEKSLNFTFIIKYTLDTHSFASYCSTIHWMMEQAPGILNYPTAATWKHAPAVLLEVEMAPVKLPESLQDVCQKQVAASLVHACRNHINVADELRAEKSSAALAMFVHKVPSRFIEELLSTTLHMLTSRCEINDCGCLKTADCGLHQTVELLLSRDDLSLINIANLMNHSAVLRKNIPDIIYKCIPHCRSLTHLNISFRHIQTHLPDLDLEFLLLSIAQHCPDLEFLDVSFIKSIDGKALRNLYKSTHVGCYKLETLIISDCHLFPSDVTDALLHLPKLCYVGYMGLGAALKILHVLNPNVHLNITHVNALNFFLHHMNQAYESEVLDDVLIEHWHGHSKKVYLLATMNFLKFTEFELKRFIPARDHGESGIQQTKNVQQDLGDEAKQFYEAVINEQSTQEAQSVHKPTCTLHGEEKIPSGQKRKLTSILTLTPFQQQRMLYRLLKSVEDNDEQGTSELLDRGVEVNSVDVYGWTPLMLAAFHGHHELTKCLVKRGANISLRNKNGLSAFDLALHQGHLGLVDYLITQNKRKMDQPDVSAEIPANEPEPVLCKECNVLVPVKERRKHLTSMVHLLNTKMTTHSSTYGIPESNKGFQMLLRSGWDKKRGLGPSGEVDAAQLRNHIKMLEWQAEEILTDKQAIVSLDQRRNKNREALRALHGVDDTKRSYVCFGNMFIKLPNKDTVAILKRDQQKLDEEIEQLRNNLKPKVNVLRDLEGKSELAVVLDVGITIKEFPLSIDGVVASYAWLKESWEFVIIILNTHFEAGHGFLLKNTRSMAEERAEKRLFVGNLFPDVKEDELRQQFVKFGDVNAVEVRHKKDVEGNVVNTFAYINVYNNSVWKGYQIRLQLAKEGFLQRLAKEREEVTSQLQKEKKTRTKSMDTKGEHSQSQDQTCQIEKLENHLSKKLSLHPAKRVKLSKCEHKEEQTELDSDISDHDGMPDFPGTKNLTGEVADALKDIFSASAEKIVSRTCRHSKEYKQQTEIFKKEMKQDDSVKDVLKRLEGFSCVWRDADESHKRSAMRCGSEEVTGNQGEMERRKKQESNQKRLQSIKEMQKMAKEKQKAIKESLKEEGKRKNKKIVFDSNLEEEGTIPLILPKKGSKKTLFDEDDDKDIEEADQFQIRPQIYAVSCWQFLELQSRYGTDERFRLDARFAEGAGADGKQEEEGVNEEKEREREKQIRILSQVLGKEIRLKKSTPRKPQMTRFDPAFQPEIKCKNENETRNKKKEKTKLEDEGDESLKIIPEVSKETAYAVSEDLTQRFRGDGKREFLISALFSQDGNFQDAEEEKKKAVKVTKKLTQIKGQSVNPFRYDSSDTDEGDEEVVEQRVNESLATNTAFILGSGSGSRWFFTPDDPRFQAAHKFLQKPDQPEQEIRAEWRAKRPALLTRLKKRTRDAVRRKRQHLSSTVTESMYRDRSYLYLRAFEDVPIDATQL
ncbi:unnamed protein product [Darwinula stevensoni]|uniref:ubiquitinyl hydrolase 1 n=1 Tax=Darwinula stevensoni TaxID=69355 RepID=A0A7R8XEB3_9CRUS|nr:unnamed protein product [Darwinula stevensoni]CAG0889491.1 unnamed protein product [Darwinula stevensoni]